MSFHTVDHLMNAILRSELLSPEQEDEVAGLLSTYPTALTLGGYLVEIDWLTEYQLQKLLAWELDQLVLGPYQILAHLGEGGLCQVFRAWDTSRGRLAALKVLYPDLAERPEMVRQFRYEAETIGRVTHPNVIKALESGREGTRHYFAMEFADGLDLERFVAVTGPLPVEHACDYTRQVAQGLQAAHQANLVHRDIKPANLFLTNPPLCEEGQPFVRKLSMDPTVKIIDWGLARAKGDEALDLGEAGEKGQLLGTADYLAPEQAQDARLVDIRADIYSLGCTLYFLLTGKPPFTGASVMQKIMQHKEMPPPSLKHARPDVPDELDGLVQRMLAKNPDDRPQVPLLMVTPLRKLAYASVGVKVGLATGAMSRPGSSPVLLRPGLAPSTAPALARPSTQSALARPSTQTSLPQFGQRVPFPRPTKKL
jgi:serine/threonine-protein kinase